MPYRVSLESGVDEAIEEVDCEEWAAVHAVLDKWHSQVHSSGRYLLNYLVRCHFDGRRSGMGLVSRALPVHTASRNCMRDEGRSFGFGNQVLIPSHRKLLRSKAMVVSIAETSGRLSWQARLGEASASEPLQKRRKRIRCCQNRGVTRPSGSVREMPETVRTASGV
jgi:hypothetical protein